MSTRGSPGGPNGAGRERTPREVTNANGSPSAGANPRLEQARLAQAREQLASAQARYLTLARRADEIESRLALHGDQMSDAHVDRLREKQDTLESQLGRAIAERDRLAGEVRALEAAATRVAPLARTGAIRANPTQQSQATQAQQLRARDAALADRQRTLSDRMDAMRAIFTSNMRGPVHQDRAAQAYDRLEAESDAIQRERDGIARQLRGQ